MHYPRWMSEENFQRYRLEVVRLMPEGAYKNALLTAIRASIAALLSRRKGVHETTSYS